MQRLGDGCGPGCGAFAELALREGCLGVGERLEDSPLRGFGPRRGIGGLDLAQPQGEPLGVVVELDLDVIEAGGSTMLDGHEDLPVSPAQVQIRVPPGVQFAASAQGLPRAGGTALSCVVLDPLVRLHGVDENTVAEVAPILGFLRDIQRRFAKASVTAYFAPAVRRQLRRLAADRDTTLQALLGEAVNDLFAKHGLPELVERD